MAKLNIAPTKSSLLSLKKQLAFAEEGYDLLEQKRQILVFELMKRLNRASAVEAQIANAIGGPKPAEAETTGPRGCGLWDCHGQRTGSTPGAWQGSPVRCATGKALQGKSLCRSKGGFLIRQRGGRWRPKGQLATWPLGQRLEEI